MSATESTFSTRDGVELFVRWLPATAPTRGTILWIHGGCEHGGRYAHVTDLITAAGYNILLPDHRGHGRSGGTRTDVDRYETYLQDLADLEQAYCPQGRADIVFGHSFGGLLAILRALQQAPRALILSAPLLELSLPVPWWKRWLGQLLIRVNPEARFRTHINPRNMTRDPQFLERRLADPLLIRSVTARWFFAMEAARAAAWRDAAHLTCPILAFQGLQDRTVNPSGISRFLDCTTSPDRTLQQFPEHVHEVLQEADWQSTTQQMLAWLPPRTHPGE